MAALLGVLIPYGSIGRMSPELWSLAGDAGGYHTALLTNASKVHSCDFLTQWLQLCYNAPLSLHTYSEFEADIPSSLPHLKLCA